MPLEQAGGASPLPAFSLSLSPLPFPRPPLPQPLCLFSSAGFQVREAVLRSQETVLHGHNVQVLADAGPKRTDTQQRGGIRGCRFQGDCAMTVSSS